MDESTPDSIRMTRPVGKEYLSGLMEVCISEISAVTNSTVKES